MKAIEFRSKIQNNQIQIPTKIRAELNSNQDTEIRVIVLMDENELYDDIVFQQSAKNRFLDGYADSDSVYDNY